MPTWRNSNFPAEKSGKYYLNQVDTVNIISDVTWVSDTPWYDVMCDKDTSPLQDSFKNS